MKFFFQIYDASGYRYLSYNKSMIIRLSGTAPSHLSQINPRNFCSSLIALSFYHDLFQQLKSDTIYTKVETCVSN